VFVAVFMAVFVAVFMAVAMFRFFSIFVLFHNIIRLRFLFAVSRRCFSATPFYT
jgi:hypothetical protein